MAIIQKPAISGSHWYFPDGRPCHTIRRASGEGERATTIADARKLGLLPSVTAILGVVGKPGLDTWKLKQVAKAAFEAPPKEGETLDYFTKRVLDAGKSEAVEAADLGSAIHSALEAAVAGEPYPDKLREYVTPALKWQEDEELEIDDREVVVVNPAHGYAGRVDAFGSAKGCFYVIDYKTRRTEPGRAIEPYEGQGAQLAAYAVARWGEMILSVVRLVNVFISTTEPGRVEVFRHENPRAEWDYFRACAYIWRRLNNYDPRKNAGH